MKLTTITYRIVGIGKGLLCHNPAQMRAGAPTIGKKKIPTPEDEAAQGVYKDEDGFYLPSIAFQRAMIRVCTGKKVGKTSARTIVSGAVLLNQEKSHLTWKGKPVTGYEIDTRRVNVQGNGVMRSRPLFPHWETSVAFEINLDYVAIEALDPLMIEAGLMVGVGDYRPEKTGWFGRFDAKRI